MSFETDGYEIIKNFLTQEQVASYRQSLDHYLDTQKCFRTNGAKIVPGFADRSPELGELNELHRSEKMLSTIQKFFGENKFIFLDHSDLHQNQMTDWHRDANDYKRGGGRPERIWEEDCFIIKVCLLLQDHTNNDKGLWFQSGTHKSNISGKQVCAHTEPTDLVVFDQRIFHRGQMGTPKYHEIYGINRYLITYGYGLDNEHSAIHIKGANNRQTEQRTYMG